MYSLKVTETFGRGLYAKRPIQPGELIARCELLVLSAEDTKRVNETDLQYYTFKFDDERDCLVLGDGELFNHSAESNVSYNLEQFDGRMVMVFRAKRAIAAGEQLFINYEDDVEVNVSEYVNKNLVG